MLEGHNHSNPGNFKIFSDIEGGGVGQENLFMAIGRYEQEFEQQNKHIFSRGL